MPNKEKINWLEKYQKIQHINNLDNDIDNRNEHANQFFKNKLIILPQNQ